MRRSRQQCHVSKSNRPKTETTTPTKHPKKVTKKGTLESRQESNRETARIPSVPLSSRKQRSLLKEKWSQGLGGWASEAPGARPPRTGWQAFQVGNHFVLHTAPTKQAARLRCFDMFRGFVQGQGRKGKNQHGKGKGKGNFGTSCLVLSRKLRKFFSFSVRV